MISAPIVEELAKGLALVGAFLVSQWAGRRFGLFEFDGVTDGIVYGAAVGIGFAFTEDLYYFFRELQLTSNLGNALHVYIDRRDFFGPAMLRHAIWTATFGAGLGMATWSRSRAKQILFPVLGLALAMAMHAIKNGLVPVILAIKYGFETTYSYLAGFVPIDLALRMDRTAESATSTLRLISWAYVAIFFAAMAVWLRWQRQVIERELVAEARRGLISRPRRIWRLASSAAASSTSA